MPYTGGSIKKSGELGKMLNVSTDSSKSKKSGPLNVPSRTGSFGGNASCSGPILSNAAGRAVYTSGPVPSGTGSAAVKKTNSGPLNKHGEPMKKSSGPQSGAVSRQNSGSVLPTTGLLTSGPIPSGPANPSGAPRKVSGPLDSSGSMKVNGFSVIHNQAVTTLSQDDEFSFRRNFPKPVLWSVILLFVMGFMAGGFILGAVHNAILLIVVVILFILVVALFTWNSCWGERAVINFISSYPDAELRTAKNGQLVKVSGVCSLGNAGRVSSYLSAATVRFSSNLLWRFIHFYFCVQ